MALLLLPTPVRAGSGSMRQALLLALGFGSRKLRLTEDSVTIGIDRLEVGVEILEQCGTRRNLLNAGGRRRSPCCWGRRGRSKRRSGGAEHGSGGDRKINP